LLRKDVAYKEPKLDRLLGMNIAAERLKPKRQLGVNDEELVLAIIGGLVALVLGSIGFYWSLYSAPPASESSQRCGHRL
jgi:hypothetical protein